VKVNLEEFELGCVLERKHPSILRVCTCTARAEWPLYVSFLLVATKM